MDAIEYFKIKNRLTKTNDCGDCTTSCEHCPLDLLNNGHDLSCVSFERKYPEEAIKLMEDWEKKHPVKTRQDNFLKLFPDAECSFYYNVASKTSIAYVNICPKLLDSNFTCHNSIDSCKWCKKEFWLEEVIE